MIRKITADVGIFSMRRSISSSLRENYDMVTAEVKGKTGLITLNRPKALNALCDALMSDIIHAAQAFDQDNRVGAIILTGNEKAFAAGADIKEMSNNTFVDSYLTNKFSEWGAISKLTKPTLAAVSGYALGGGCELAMMCDIIIAAENAKFGLPEVTLGVIPGCGGTQRLIRAIGKVKAMEMILTGSMIDAATAERVGLVSRVVPKEELLDTALSLSNQISSLSRPVIAMAKEAVLASEELSLQEGLRLERRLFHSLFALEDQKEGTLAFAEKRPAIWKHK
mmetsp:Transcript_21993/g.22175  ORF Transcript_21993/g.22175 Transcript_21993/m.22175 type:complete len:281 (+) Transcript_21993:116-958(+)|eukprot:CAMPEP_0182421164 /NCGR_PEP_ID=MMETSP1167-20130531/6415_1 /TAXON_ID=2988 /ORGANISM="Mallomonas Sp, Strain CCMP3275" /LENGTH=280 /DNA_ID=CAMNT_0024598015 /DNA_START=90 /DNA_END=932 /DNA_ORIENTATION=-